MLESYVCAAAVAHPKSLFCLSYKSDLVKLLATISRLEVSDQNFGELVRAERLNSSIAGTAIS